MSTSVPEAEVSPTLFSNPHFPATHQNLSSHQGSNPYGAGANGDAKDAATNGDAAAYTNGAAAMWHEQAAAAKAAGGGAGAAAAAAGSGGSGGEVWMDERELKRQRRKQSNRESARRSRLRKQAECEDLGGRVDALSTENVTLRAELARLKETCGALETDNTVLTDKLKDLKGPDAVEAVKKEVAKKKEAAKGEEELKMKENEKNGKNGELTNGKRKAEAA